MILYISFLLKMKNKRKLIYYNKIQIEVGDLILSHETLERKLTFLNNYLISNKSD